MSSPLRRATEAPPGQGLGLMRLGHPEADAGADPVAVVHAALDHGVTVLDTAEMYGNEDLVGRAVAGRRDEVVLCSKFGVRWGDSGRFDDWSVHADRASVVRSCDASLSRLGVDLIDVYYLHHRSDETPIEETVTAMAQLVAAGKIREIGLSNVTVEDVRRAHAVHPVSALQEQWSLAADAAEEFLPAVADLDIVLVAHSPLGHGQLSGDTAPAPLRAALAGPAARLGVTPAQVALAWVHHQSRPDRPVLPLPGTTSLGHLRTNIEAASIRLTDDELRALSVARLRTAPR
ncbi:aryl-alcohol dehydrogenase-like predicted oxidoreductase [Actinomycetospora succinea]|uniref:Aryl-alcohol dehydrogenase-like predicted oxidoreductase n=1 Tax=Actinomycetospora succinea TaxID=663603 RepID=A0A4R6VKQ9_9PSEU|nr:aldo/keto reductase [Actinomycetospora succinea]TDQ62515.1 aryl-alcohol dehydrogenase-like predicted oxidoreductase [Actinomycetospora succinea]